MAQVNLATVDAMLIAIDNALENIVPAGGIADAAALGTLTGRVSDAEMALGERALVTALTAESQARTDADTAINSALALRVATAELGVGVATLENGKIPASQLPALATTETFVVASQTEQLALAAQPGDFAVRTDFNPHRNYILTTNDPSNFNNWRQLSAPGAVTSVDGMTGAVTLGSTAVVSNTLARRTPTGQLAVAAAVEDGEAIEHAQFLAALTPFGRDRGSGTDLPTTDLRRGDVYFHTGFGCLMVYTGAAWRQVDVAVAADTPARTSISTTYAAALHPGFRVRQTDTGITWEWSGTAWGIAIHVDVPDTETAYAAGWARYTDTTINWAGLRYWKVAGNVTVTGAFQAIAATAAQAVICTLPAALWPKNPVQGTPGYHIRTDGTVRSSAARASGFIDSIMFAYGVT